MVDPVTLREGKARRGRFTVLALQAAAVALVAAWFATGHAAAPDDGLLQLDVLSLSERVPGVASVDGRPTMVVVTCETEVRRERLLSPSYGLVVSTDPVLAERLALPKATSRCQSGYVLVDHHDLVRYRTYDPGWQSHPEEQEILLEHLAHEP